MRILALLLASAAACAATAPNRERSVRDINTLLDDWHFAAAKADGDAYFGAIAERGVFLGTDPRERWTKAEFREYAAPYFSRGAGWKYLPKNRHVMLSRDGAYAWFDEKLENANYGELRGTGVLKRTPEGWRILHYNLSFAVPNTKTRAVVDIITAGR